MAGGGHLGCGRRILRRSLPLAALLAGCWSSPYSEVDLDRTLATRSAAQPELERGRTLRFSVAAMQSPRGTYHMYSRLFSRVGARVGLEVELVQRRTYREVNELLASGQLHVAFVCTGGYLDLARRPDVKAELLVAPVVKGKTTYESLVIVPSSSGVTAIQQLAGKEFAFTDELSLSGHRYLVHLLRGMGTSPARLFGATIFTHSHDRSIHAVAKGLVDGAAIDGNAFGLLLDRHPSLAGQIAVIHRSAPLGIPPLVVSTELPPYVRQLLRRAFLELHEDPEAAALLRETHIERFVEISPRAYDGAAEILRP